MSVLDSVLPEYEPISRAPKLAYLVAQAKDNSEYLDRLIKAERSKLYKSIDSTGIVYLIQNPEVWEWDAKAKACIRPAPLKQGPLGQLRGSQATSHINPAMTWGYR